MSDDEKKRHMKHITYLNVLAAQLKQSGKLERSAQLLNLNSVDVTLASIGYSSQFIGELLKKLRHLSQLSKSLLNLSGLISDIRIFNRLWGMIDMLLWAADTAENPPKDKILRWVAYVQVIVNLIYQPLENLAYLASHGIVPLSKRVESKLWIYSCYMWAIHVQADFIRLYREHQLGNSMNGSWLKSLVANVCYAPLTIHWSLEQGCLAPMTVGFLGATAAIPGAYSVWKSVLL